MNAERRPPTLRERFHGCSERVGLGSLFCSLWLHLMFAVLAMALVWRLWPGELLTAELQLIEPRDGGARGSTVTLTPKEKAKVRAAAGRMKVLHSRVPSVVSVATKFAPQPAFDPVSQPYLPGSGWNDGVGKTPWPGNGGDGWGPGSGVGYSSSFVSCGSRRTVKPCGGTVPQSQSFAIVLDVSGSMGARGGDGADSAALREFVSCIYTLSPDIRFNVVCFAENACAFRDAGVPATPENVAAAVNFARTLYRDSKSVPEGAVLFGAAEGSSGTSRVDLGMKAAFAGRPDEVLLISDGCPVVRQGSRSLLRNEVLLAIGHGVPGDGRLPVLHTIAISSGGSGFLRRLAADFEGQFRSAAPD